VTPLELLDAIDARLQEASEDCARACEAMLAICREHGSVYGDPSTSPGYHAAGASVEITTARANLALLRRLLETTS